MSRPSSLRGRLTAVFAGSAGLLVVAAAFSTEALIEQAFWAALDGALAEEAETLASILEVGRLEEIPKLVARIEAEREPGPGKFVLVRERDGRILARAGRMPDTITRESIEGTGVARTLWYRGEPYRVAFARAANGAVCTIGVPVHGETGAMRRARWAIAGGACVLIGVFSALAWAVTSRATAELDRLAAELETVEAGSLHKRLSRRETSEVDRLVGVLNRLLQRLDSATASLRRFTADAAHELRTPIAALRAHIDLAVAAAGPAPPASLLDAVEQSDRLGRLAEDLLTLSSVEAGESARRDSVVRLDELAREVIDVMEPIASEQGRKLVQKVDTDISIQGEPTLLRRLVLNLVDNALRHTPTAAPISVTLRAADGRAILEVRDEGPGIDPADAPRAFERFHRGKGGGSGTGLGLAICREIAKRHGGEIELASVTGRGTTVRVELPLASR